MINYDPDGKPNLDPQAIAEAEQFGLRPILVICDEPGAKVGDHRGVSFVAFTAFLPAAGDRIELEDGSLCEVKRVYFKLSRQPEASFVGMVPNVVAVRIDGESKG